MNLVLQNPLLRVVRDYGWAPLLVGVSLALVLGGFHAPTAVGVVAGLLVGTTAGVVAAGVLRTKRARETLEARRKSDGLVFVCPHCLIADTPTRSCPGCRKPLPAELHLTDGEIVGYCPECRRDLSAEALSHAPAACAHCGESGDAVKWLRQRARVVGTLSEHDFGIVAELIGGSVQRNQGLRHVRAETGSEALFVLCLADLGSSRSELPAHHAASRLSAVWVDQVDALSGTEALDRLSQRTGLSPASLKQIELSVTGAVLDPAMERAFAARLGLPQRQVTASAFIQHVGSNSNLPTGATAQTEKEA